jgi:hypothetical protein
MLLLSSTRLHDEGISSFDTQGVCSSSGTVSADDILSCDEFCGSSSPSMQEVQSGLESIMASNWSDCRQTSDFDRIH